MSDRSLYTSRDKSLIQQVRKNTQHFVFLPPHAFSFCFCGWLHYEVSLILSSLEVYLFISMHITSILRLTVSVSCFMALRSYLLRSEISLADNDLIFDTHMCAQTCLLVHLCSVMHCMNVFVLYEICWCVQTFTLKLICVCNGIFAAGVNSISCTVWTFALL